MSRQGRGKGGVGFKMNCFVDGRQYDTLMQGHRQCVVCNKFVKKQDMRYSTTKRGLVCKPCDALLTTAD